VTDYFPSSISFARAALLAVSAAAIVSVSPLAFAQSGTEADAAISKGVELRRQGKDEEALEFFQRANKLAPSPRAKAQIGLAEQAIGRWADAERDLGEAMAVGSDPWIAKQHSVLGEALNVIRRHVGSLTVKGEPAGAVVEMDGEAVGVLPLPDRHVTAGEVVVTVRASGYVSVTRKVSVTPGELAAEVFHLKRLDSEVAAPALAGRGPESEPTAVHGPAELAGVVTTASPADQPPPTGGPGRLRTAAWVTGAAGGLSLVAGVTFLLLGKSKADSFNGDNTCDLNNSGGVVGGSHCQDIYDSWHTNRAIGIVGVSAGAVLAAASAVLFVKTQPGASANGTTSQALAACGVGPGRGVACAVRF
jgi:hypothetical protein